MGADQVECAECGGAVDAAAAIQIDGRFVCHRCLYGEAEPFSMYPIGTVRNDLQRPATGFGVSGSRGISRIELLPTMQQFMRGVAEESHLTIVFALHKARGVRISFPRGLDRKVVGIFASRSPDRLNPIGITEVELVKVEGTTLYVRGLDAIDGSPVLDVKLGAKGLRG